MQSGVNAGHQDIPLSCQRLQREDGDSKDQHHYPDQQKDSYSRHDPREGVCQTFMEGAGRITCAYCGTKRPRPAASELHDSSSLRLVKRNPKSPWWKKTLLTCVSFLPRSLRRRERRVRHLFCFLCFFWCAQWLKTATAAKSTTVHVCQR